jgi:hypothetical protein
LPDLDLCLRALERRFIGLRIECGLVESLDRDRLSARKFLRACKLGAIEGDGGLKKDIARRESP